MNWANLLPDDFVSSVVAGQIRSLLLAGAGFLIAHGWLATADEPSFVRISTGIAVGVFSMLWSAWAKSDHKIVISVVKKQQPSTTPIGA